MSQQVCKKCEDYKMESELYLAQAQDLANQLRAAWEELEKHGLNRFVTPKKSKESK